MQLTTALSPIALFPLLRLPLISLNQVESCKRSPALFRRRLSYTLFFQSIMSVVVQPWKYQTVDPGICFHFTVYLENLSFEKLRKSARYDLQETYLESGILKEDGGISAGTTGFFVTFSRNCPYLAASCQETWFLSISLNFQKSTP